MPAIRRSALTRDAALSAFVPGGPAPEGWSAFVNMAVNRCAAACGVMPSCAATEVASELAKRAMTSSSEVPRSSCALMAATRSASGVVAELALALDVGADVDAAAVGFVAAAETAAIEPSRVAWKSPPPPSDLELPGRPVPAPPEGEILGVGIVRIGVRVSPPFGER